MKKKIIIGIIILVLLYVWAELGVGIGATALILGHM